MTPASASVFLVTGLAQFWIYLRGTAPASMAFATVGDTINVTSRLQSLTRDLGATIVASGALVVAIEREAADGVVLLQGLAPRGVRTQRGRDTALEL